MHGGQGFGIAQHHEIGLVELLDNLILCAGDNPVFLLFHEINFTKGQQRKEVEQHPALSGQHTVQIGIQVSVHADPPHDSARSDPMRNFEHIERYFGIVRQPGGAGPYKEIGFGDAVYHFASAVRRRKSE